MVDAFGRVAPALLLSLAALPRPAWCETHTVVIEGMRFQPAVLAVKRGDRVVWLNSDVVPHTATAATTAKSFDSSTIAPGASWAMTAKQPGQLDYVCTLHPMMKASLVVKER